MCHFYIQCNLPFLEEQMSSLLSLFQFAFFFWRQSQIAIKTLLNFTLKCLLFGVKGGE